MGRYGYNDLDAAVADMPGCRRVDHSLGIQKMPEGYALMLDTDGVYFFWLDAEGNEGPSDWNMWRVRRDAIARQKHNAALQEPEHSDDLHQRQREHAICVKHHD